jgi:hypothetical protein
MIIPNIDYIPDILDTEDIDYIPDIPDIEDIDTIKPLE